MYSSGYRAVSSLTCVGALMFAGTACAQDYPRQPIRIVTAEAGGGNDVQARLIAPGLSAALGQQVVVDNRPSGVVPGETVAKAAADGYTLLLYNNALWIGPLMQKTPYDPQHDFTPITTVTKAVNVLVVYPGLPVKSVAELIAYAKSKPGELNYGSSGTGASNHLAAELFKAMAGVNLVRVNYKGGNPALNALFAGDLQVMFPTAGAVAAYMKSGRLRVLAVTSLEPSALIPGVPTVAASGLPGYESIALYGIFGPAGMPKPIVDRLRNEITKVLNKPDIKEKFFNAGMETAGGSPDQLAAAVKSETLRMDKVIKDAGIRVE